MRPNNETSRKTILVEGGAERRAPPIPMGFFARRLTTISIVYDFNNLGAALLARLDTFLVVNRATKSVFMGRRRPIFFLPFAFFVCDSLVPLPSFCGAERKETTVRSRIDQKGPRWLGTDPLVPLASDRSELVARKTAAWFPFLRAYTLTRG